MPQPDTSLPARLLQWLLGLGGNLLSAALIFLAGWWLAKLAARLTKNAVKKGRADPLVAGFIGSLVKAVVLMVTAVSAVAQLQININSLIAALGAAGLTASFALQGSLSNLVSGMQIIFTKPFKMGDYLAFGGYEGTVKRIEILYTVLATFDNKDVIVPNSKITGDVVVNFTTNGTRRLDLSYGVSYSADLQKAKRLLRKLAEKDVRVLDVPEPVIAVGELKDSSVTLVMKLWCKQEEYWNLYFTMQEAVKLAFDKAGVPIPFPQLDVHLDRSPAEEEENK
ncbi:MAG: mechanosensitive ion channel [Acutalibacter sp.]|nr:mechanosensitive ion channel [Acutalibacter sp.]